MTPVRGERASFDSLALGRRLRRVRLARGVTLKEIEAKAGVSATHVSEVERGKSTPTVGMLVNIARALDVELSSFLEEARGRRAIRVTRSGARPWLVLAGGDLSLRPVTGARPEAEMSLFEVQIGAQSKGEPRPQRGWGEEVIVVLRGSIGILSPEGAIALEAGDAARLVTRQGFQLVNHGVDTAQLLWATTPAYVL
jgi:transcriptional regulator with XRE-family HTH domain